MFIIFYSEHFTYFSLFFRKFGPATTAFLLDRAKYLLGSSVKESDAGIMRRYWKHIHHVKKQADGVRAEKRKKTD